MQHDLAMVAHVYRLAAGPAVVEMPPLVGKVANIEGEFTLFRVEFLNAAFYG
jgi:hypothetical protein